MKGTAMAGDRAGLLFRVSSGGQDEANQEPDVERYAAGHGYRTSQRSRWVLHDKSAYKGEQQTALDEIVAQVRAGLVKVLVVWHSDRLDRRGVLEALTFLRAVTDAGGRVESVQEGVLSERNLITIIGAHMNHEKSAHLSEQVRLAHTRIRENGAFAGRDPFGYRIEGAKYAKRLVPIEDLRPVVTEIFGRVIRGESLADVCVWLDSLKVKRSKTTTAKYRAGEVTPWWPTMLMRLVRHPAYAGTYFVRRTGDDGKPSTYAHKCEPMVTRAVQRQAIEALTGREKRGPRGNPGTRAMLKGAISCPGCAGPMYRLTGRLAGGTADYYRCFGRGAQRKGCGNMALMAAVDSAVDRIIAGTFARPVTRVTLIRGHDWSDEIDAIKDELRSLNDAGLDDDSYDRRHAGLVAERDRLKGLPALPDELREEETGELWSEVYAAVGRPDRGAWLHAHGFAVTATKAAVTVSQGAVSFTEPLG